MGSAPCSSRTVAVCGGCNWPTCAAAARTSSSFFGSRRPAFLDEGLDRLGPVVFHDHLKSPVPIGVDVGELPTLRIPRCLSANRELLLLAPSSASFAPSSAYLEQRLLRRSPSPCDSRPPPGEPCSPDAPPPHEAAPGNLLGLLRRLRLLRGLLPRRCSCSDFHPAAQAARGNVSGGEKCGELRAADTTPPPPLPGRSRCRGRIDVSMSLWPLYPAQSAGFRWCLSAWGRAVLEQDGRGLAAVEPHWQRCEDLLIVLRVHVDRPFSMRASTASGQSCFAITSVSTVFRLAST